MSALEIVKGVVVGVGTIDTLRAQTNHPSFLFPDIMEEMDGVREPADHIATVSLDTP
jgi:hypothetical protein